MIEIAIGIFFAVLDDRKKQERRRREHPRQVDQHCPDNAETGRRRRARRHNSRGAGRQ